MSSEHQKPFNKIGYLNAEIITRKAYCKDKADKRCECEICGAARLSLKLKVNCLMGRRFYPVGTIPIEDV